MVDVIHYRFHLELTDGNNRIKGRAELEVVFGTVGTRELELHLVAVGENGQGMKVRQVNREGRRLDFSHQKDQLTVKLAETTRTGERRSFQVVYEGEPADGLVISQNKHGDRTFFADNWPNRARHWLPSVDHPSDKATVEFLVTAPNHYQVVANGVLVEESDLTHNRRLSHWVTKVPMATKVMVIGVGRFAIQHLEEVDGIALQTWVYPQDRDAGFSDFSLATSVLAYFAKTIGPFPYAKLANVQSKTRFGGMENAGAIFYNENSVKGTGANEALIAHEIAHQWFGDSVTETDWPHLWLSEGFATYLTMVYLEDRYGRERLVQRLKNARDRIFRFYQTQPQIPVVQTNVSDLMDLLNANSYQKGAWVLHMLRGVIGDQAFRAALRNYYGKYRDGNAASQDFQNIAEQASGQDLGWFFEQWLMRPGHPQLDLGWHHNGEALVVTVTQTQQGEAFRVPNLQIQVSDPKTRVVILALESKQQEFRIAAKAKPKSVTLDPNLWLLWQAAVP